MEVLVGAVVGATGRTRWRRLPAGCRALPPWLTCGRRYLMTSVAAPSPPAWSCLGVGTPGRLLMASTGPGRARGPGCNAARTSLLRAGVHRRCGRPIRGGSAGPRSRRAGRRRGTIFDWLAEIRRMRSGSALNGAPTPAPSWAEAAELRGALADRPNSRAKAPHLVAGKLPVTPCGLRRTTWAGCRPGCRTGPDASESA